MKKNIIILIGGPGTGKTTLLDGLQKLGYCCYPEISREITLEAQKNGVEQLFLEQPLLFSELLLKGRENQYKNALKETHNIVFIDRGLPDVLAYLHYLNQDYPNEYQDYCTKYKYNQVFVLPPWDEIYETDQARYENFDQSKSIHAHIVNTYTNLGYQPIEVPKDTVVNRIEFILNSISKVG